MRKGKLVLHTHWDREWRYPLWENRMYLCNMVDELLHILDTQPDYRSFVMDGQTVIIEDYLEVRPENREKIEKYSFWGVCFFVALPLPVTGAWTGTLVAATIGMKFWKAMLSCFIGVLIAGVIVTCISYGALAAFSWLL